MINSCEIDENKHSANIQLINSDIQEIVDTYNSIVDKVQKRLRVGKLNHIQPENIKINDVNIFFGEIYFDRIKEYKPITGGMIVVVNHKRFGLCARIVVKRDTFSYFDIVRDKEYVIRDFNDSYYELISLSNKNCNKARYYIVFFERYKKFVKSMYERFVKHIKRTLPYYKEISYNDILTTYHPSCCYYIFIKDVMNIKDMYMSLIFDLHNMAIVTVRYILNANGVRELTPLTNYNKRNLNYKQLTKEVINQNIDKLNKYIAEQQFTADGLITAIAVVA
jgi:hypothetical protein